MYDGIITKLTKVKPGNIIQQARFQTRWQRFASIPLIRILLAYLFIVPFALAYKPLSSFISTRFTGNLNLTIQTIFAILIIVIVSKLYSLYCSKLEGREAKELSLAYAWQEWGWGFLISLVLLDIMVGILFAGGMYQINSMSALHVIFKAIYVFAVGAFLQEMIYRVVLFKIAEEVIGSLRAVIFIGIVFAMAHFDNVNSDMESVISMFLSDFLLSAAFILTRRIWMVWGIHAGWNFVQDGILGMPNSGINSFPSLLHPVIKGPEWLTGGTFGIEASLNSVILNLGLAIVILWVAYKQGQWVIIHRDKVIK